ncbi:MAG: hypothetical protein ACO3JG_12660 [Luteolibacter sp.]
MSGVAFAVTGKLAFSADSAGVSPTADFFTVFLADFVAAFFAVFLAAGALGRLASGDFLMVFFAGMARGVGGVDQASEMPSNP